MSNRVYRVTEIVGTSPDGIDQAIRNGIERASRRCATSTGSRSPRSAARSRTRTVEHFQVGLKLGFRLEDD